MANYQFRKEKKITHAFIIFSSSLACSDMFMSTIPFSRPESESLWETCCGSDTSCSVTAKPFVFDSDSSEMSPRRSGLVGSPVGSSRLECSPLLLFSISSYASLMVEASSFEGSGVAGVAS